MFNIGFHGSHNATIALSYEDTILEVVEIERYLSHKNAALFYYESPMEACNMVYYVNQYFRNKYSIDEYDNIIYNSVDESKFSFVENFGDYNDFSYCLHHVAHASCAFYQSTYDEALAVSFDGGSDEGFFNIYLMKRGEDPERLHSGVMDYAVSYQSAGHHIRNIKHEENIYVGNLVYPGKLMGFVGYGEYNEEFAERLTSYYKSNTYDHIGHASDRFVAKFKDIMDDEYFFSDKDGKDIATTNQIVFERLFYEEVKPFLEKYPNLPLVLTGGCALNIINNTKLAAEREVFVPPNPSDTGIAVGCLMNHLRPENPIDITYSGSPVWDQMEIGRYIREREGRGIGADEVADIILDGGVIGIVRGGGEHGPRALGNRSLLCDATNPEMKDFMNSKVKNREPFRPFSPIVRLQDVNEYFEWDSECKYMTFSPPVREEYKELLSSITHVDGTARIQTITEEQNEFIYSILTRMKEKTGHGVLLNTSFNVAGKPILNTYREAFEVLDTRPITGLVLEDMYFEKCQL